MLGRAAVCATRAAFAQLGSDQKSRLVLLDLGSLGQTVLSAQSDSEPAFFPGCARLAFTSLRHANPEVLWASVADAGAATRATFDAAIDGLPTVSPVPR